MNAERARLFAAYYEDPRDPDDLIDLVGLRPVARTGTNGCLVGSSGGRLGACTHRQAPRRFLGRADGGRRPGRAYSGARHVDGLRTDGVCVILTGMSSTKCSAWPTGSSSSTMARSWPPGAKGRTPRRVGRASFAAAPGLAMASRRLTRCSVSEGPPGEYLVSAPPIPALVAELAAWLAEHDLQ